MFSGLHFFKILDASIWIIFLLPCPYPSILHALPSLRSLPGITLATTLALPSRHIMPLVKLGLCTLSLAFFLYCVILCVHACSSAQDWQPLSASTRLVNRGVLSIWHVADIQWLQSGWKWISAWSIFFIFSTQPRNKTHLVDELWGWISQKEQESI